jgi:hypothetical protein
MFKSKEELMEEMISTNYGNERKTGYHMGLIDAFKSIAERKKFYEKYYGCHSQELIHDHPEIYKKYEEHMTELEKTEHIEQEDFEEEYNCWLYHYCFDGV